VKGCSLLGFTSHSGYPARTSVATTAWAAIQTTESLYTTTRIKLPT